MLKHFFKYQSLGNDFVIYDWYKKPNVFVQNALSDSNWDDFIKKICSRNFGIGADGVLIIKSNPGSSYPEMLIFNSDGSQAQMCMNGISCVAHHLFTHHGLQKTFQIQIGDKIVECTILFDNQNESSILISSNIGPGTYQKQITLSNNNLALEGHIVTIGNPHFVVFKQIELNWLKENGSKIEQHKSFPDRTNVEFIWLNNKKNNQENNNITKQYSLLVYERGCGITLACGSGTAASLWALFHNKLISHEEKVEFSMPGGKIIGYIDLNKNIILQTRANIVFRGEISHHE